MVSTRPMKMNGYPSLRTGTRIDLAESSTDFASKAKSDPHQIEAEAGKLNHGKPGLGRLADGRAPLAAELWEPARHLGGIIGVGLAQPGLQIGLLQADMDR